MCLLICVRGGDGSLVLAANRDEGYDRPTTQPFVWERRPRLLAGRDDRAGGAWLAVNEWGVVAAVTNRPTLDGEDAARPTRGDLPLLACRHADAAAARRGLDSHLRSTRYNGFNLFVGDPRGAFVIEAPGPEPRFHEVGGGVSIVANGAWNDPDDDRVRQARAVLSRHGDLGEIDKLVSALMDVCRDHQPTADGRALCLHADQGGTVSSTVLALDSAGRLTRYRHAPGPPCSTPYQELALFGAGM